MPWSGERGPLVRLHHDFAGVGVALHDRINVYRIEKLKEMGANAYRASHNPPTAEALDACDRLGMLVVNENRHMGDSEEVLATLESWKVWCGATGTTPAS